MVQSTDRKWRHLDLAGAKLFLAYTVRRVYCTSCGLRTEKVPWALTPSSRYTRDFEFQVAHLAQRTDKTSVQRLMRISWRSVGRCIERVMSELADGDPLADLRQICIDEISYRKFHQYLTLVANADTGQIVWGAEGKTMEVLDEFFDELGEERIAELESICTDMSKTFTQSVAIRAPKARHVYDRFHVQRLVNQALDETRRSEWGRLERAATKGSRWALLKNPQDLTEAQATKLSEVQQDNRRLYRGYLLKEQFREILDGRQPNIARVMLLEWCDWASRSKLKPFVRVAERIRVHLPKIVEYVRTRLTNGLIEGINARVRLIFRRAYGFHSAQAALALVKLCCCGVRLEPVTKRLRT